MTEKRFTINSYSSYDTTTIKDNSSTRVLSVIDCVDELNYLNKVGNELYKKNEQLKIRFREEKDTAMKLGSECDTLTIQNHEFKKENEQLKQQLNYLQNSISEHIKHQKTELGQKALQEIIEDYNEWLLGHKRL